MTQLATRFQHVRLARADTPLTDEAIRQVAPSIFAAGAHPSRSGHYGYIPTSEVLNGLRREGFQPFLACQSVVRDAGRQSFTKHLLRLRHADRIQGEEANEIVLVNSHDGSSSYQMLAGVYRFVCHNGLVCGDTLEDLRLPHRGDVIGRVIDGAYRILDDFQHIDRQKDGMKAMSLMPEERRAFAQAALALRYTHGSDAPVSADRLLSPQRVDDIGSDLWTTFNVIQEHLIRGGLRGRDRRGRRVSTRPLTSIDSNLRLNRALWTLAEAMQRLKEETQTLFDTAEGALNRLSA